MYLSWNKKIISLLTLISLGISQNTYASNAYSRKMEQQRKVQQGNHQKKQDKKQQEFFQCFSKLNFDDPKTWIFLGLIGSAGLIGTYQYLQGAPASATSSHAILAHTDPAEPIVVEETVSFSKYEQASNSSSSPECLSQAKVLAKLQGGNIPSYAARAVHPGAFTVNTPSGGLVVQIDRPELNFKSLDAVHYQDFIKFQHATEKVNIIQNLSKYSETEFLLFLKSLHKSVSGESQDFRSQDILIMHPSIPKMNDGQKVLRHFKESPKLLEKYKKFKDLVNQHRHASVFQGLPDLNIWESIVGSVMRSDDTYFDHFKPLCQKFYTYNGLEKKQIETSLKKLWGSVKRLIHINPLTAAAKFHMGLVEIHPFLDGNGRTVRLLTQKLLQENGLPAFPLLSEKKYTRAVHASMKQRNLTPFENYLREQICAATKPEFKNGEEIEEIAKTCHQRGHCEEELREVADRFKI
ncbi:MAG: hypothetical protein BGO77_04035 [Caedibacter sp. 37-49]|nr:MAG: hypothetical protein BGO77_04035 [Caedibacter sp. 37-49]